MATKIGTLQNPEKTEALLPRTCLKAVADKNGDYIDEDVLASDINALKNGAISSLSDIVPDTPIKIGKWCGYDLYRVYVNGNLDPQNAFVHLATLPQNAVVVSAVGRVKDYDNNYMIIGCYLNANWNCGVWVDNTQHKVSLYYTIPATGTYELYYEYYVTT